MSLGLGRGARAVPAQSDRGARVCARPHTWLKQALLPLPPIALRSWHHRSFDKEADVPGVPPASAWTITDYSACRWPSSVPGETFF